jgi:dTDP-4-amino-4,6-dideoxygalactose transaminase
VIESIAKKHQLKVIYDAAHSFSTTYKGKSVFSYGDLSTCSFHATKLFHTGEGGALFCNTKEYELQSFYSHNFGHKSATEFYGVGINGKLSELQAAMGLTVLPFMNKILEGRKKVVDYYNTHLDFSKLKKMELRENTDWNYSYYPVIFENEATLLKTQEALNEVEVYPRRYFYPSLNTLNYVNNINMPVSESIAERILCLPMYYDLNTEDLENIISIINNY